MNKLKTFLSFNWQTKTLLFESYIYLGLARILKGLPFSRVAPSLGDQMAETAYTFHSSDKETLSLIKQAIHIMSRYTFWESQCLVKAIAAMKMLERRQIESTLYLGTAKDEKGEFIAHAWLRSGPFYVTGSEGMERFTVVSKFAKRIESGM
ncbi:lasso peptide biosynthesis B2 protein [Oceanobacillus sp. 143]|uniref:Stage V sporulation protein S n=1 Tax=Oceanobacillus zhaokaii TaxID=2052660 RepID=A0A345PL83_9BACI|nr:lasso peptide biosynthesis B2 protein [Oceanobacillus zhaokaii]AXI10763.1 stage V sporulation protein S [Oceanobacillus zhaokaii]QGS69678.1 lasso peptide biosynthesis B2 protein [Oceanobacillus sp. 143]